ncbi:CBS domain-containing protein [Streptomyces sp. NPDC054797]
MVDQVIHKQPQAGAMFRLQDYERTRTEFTWGEARSWLAGLPGGGLNIGYEAVDRHVAAGRGAREALRCISRDDYITRVSYSELAGLTGRFAHVLKSLGVARQERVFTLLGRCPELYVTVLGTLRGAHVLCPLFSAFGPDPVRRRLELGDARVLVTTEALYRRKVQEHRHLLPHLEHALLVGGHVTVTVEPEHTRGGKSRPLLADPDCAVHGHQPLLPHPRKDSFRHPYGITAHPLPPGPNSPQWTPDGTGPGGSGPARSGMRGGSHRGGVMKHLRTVDDVMTHAVISVDSRAPFKDIVETMRQWRISAVPVLSGEGRVAGVVSEADLLLKAQGADESRSVTAGQLMTVPAVTVGRDATIPGAARLMALRHLKRLPVVDNGRLVGIVSRGDLLKIYLRPDADIAEELRALIMAELLPAGSAMVHVHVADGIVYLTGSVPDASLSDVLVRVARTVPGVVDVTAQLDEAIPA